MAVTFPLLGPAFVDMNNTQPSYLYYIEQTLVPGLGDDVFWSLTNFTIEAVTGYIDSSAVAASSVASRYTPGVIVGHLYKVVIVVAATDEDLVVTMGGATLGTIIAAGTTTYYVRPTDGDPLAITTTAVATTASVTSVVVTAEEPINPDLIPVA
jgi:hypothetical protein